MLARLHARRAPILLVIPCCRTRPRARPPSGNWWWTWVHARRSPAAATTGSRARCSALLVPAPAPPVRTDGLWRHTCFEAFIAPAGSSEYWEYNFSPSGAWAAYHFTAYRTGMTPLDAGRRAGHRRRSGRGAVHAHRTLDLGWLARPHGWPGCVLAWRPSSKTARRGCHTGRSSMRRRSPIFIVPTVLWLRSRDLWYLAPVKEHA